MVTTSSLKIVDNRVFECFVNNHELDTFLKDTESKDVDLSVVYGFKSPKKDDGESTIRLDLEVKVFESGNVEKIFINLRHSTIFDFSEPDVDWQTFAPNMISMAFPYIRAYITGITALAGVQPLILPAINAFDVLAKTDVEE